MTDPEKDLLLSILALDSYNQGYGVGIEGLFVAAGQQVGTTNWTAA